MPTEADTCRTLITPKLLAAGWDSDPHSIAEQRTFTDGRIIAHGGQAHHQLAKRANTAEKVLALCASPGELRPRWADAGQRADIIHQLAGRGIWSRAILDRLGARHF